MGNFFNLLNLISSENQGKVKFFVKLVFLGKKKKKKKQSHGDEFYSLRKEKIIV